MHFWEYLGETKTFHSVTFLPCVVDEVFTEVSLFQKASPVVKIPCCAAVNCLTPF